MNSFTILLIILLIVIALFALLKESPTIKTKNKCRGVGSSSPDDNLLDTVVASSLLSSHDDCSGSYNDSGSGSGGGDYD